MPDITAAVAKFVEPPNQYRHAYASPPLRACEPKDQSDTLQLVGKDGHRRQMDLAAVDQVVRWACAGIPSVETRLLVELCRQSLQQGMNAGEVGPALVTAVLPLIENSAGYSQVCARLLLDSLWDEASSGLGQQTAHGGDFRFAQYPAMFVASIRRGVELGLLPASLLAFDLDRLGEALCPERDKAFAYPALRQLSDHDLLQSQGTRIELPQGYCMRLAMAQALEEGCFNERAIEIYLAPAR
jgi:ribonucleoside-diphosphate reductase alpha chain